MYSRALCPETRSSNFLMAFSNAITIAIHMLHRQTINFFRFERSITLFFIKKMHKITRDEAESNGGIRIHEYLLLFDIAPFFSIP